MGSYIAKQQNVSDKQAKIVDDQHINTNFHDSKILPWQPQGTGPLLRKMKILLSIGGQSDLHDTESQYQPKDIPLRYFRDNH